MIKEKKCEVLSMTRIAKLYRKNYNNLTKAEKQIAEYICENSKKVIMMTSLELGKELNVSDATVLRFSKKNRIFQI